MSRQIRVDNSTYEWTVEDGRNVLRKFNSKYKMWVTLRFSTENTTINDRIIKILSDEFISKNT